MRRTYAQKQKKLLGRDVTETFYSFKKNDTQMSPGELKKQRRQVSAKPTTSKN